MIIPRIGIGYDVHKFADGRRLVLGGEEIPFEQGLLGHSDADVLLHAIIDALLGAAAFGDIGMHFPDSDEENRDISSCEMLLVVVEVLHRRGYSVGNIDSVIIADKPKLADYIQKMRINIGRLCKISPNAVSVKATTEEGLGLAGQGIGAKAVCTIFLSEG
jgi:2-C-methyl-D-erythritol 2,4-cyclodiphosphate synthase